MDSIAKTGLNAIQAGMQSAFENSQKVTRPSDEMIDGLIGLKFDSLQVKAGAKLVKTGVDLEKTILDIIA